MELLVVILIIGILAAIAIPSFLNQQDKGHDVDAKSTASTAAQAFEACKIESSAGSYAPCSVASLTAIEPALNDAGARLDVTSTTNTYQVTVTANRDSRRRGVHAVPPDDRSEDPHVLDRQRRQGRLLRPVERHLVAPRAPVTGCACAT